MAKMLKIPCRAQNVVYNVVSISECELVGQARNRNTAYGLLVYFAFWRFSNKKAILALRKSQNFPPSNGFFNILRALHGNPSFISRKNSLKKNKRKMKKVDGFYRALLYSVVFPFLCAKQKACAMWAEEAFHSLLSPYLSIPVPFSLMVLLILLSLFPYLHVWRSPSPGAFGMHGEQYKKGTFTKGCPRDSA